MTDEDRPQLDPLAPYPTPDEREAGQLPEPELYEGVPPHLDVHLRTWVARALKDQDGLARTVATRCRMSWPAVIKGSGDSPIRLTSQGALSRVMAGQTQEITSPRPLDRLTIVDAIISLHPHREADNDPLDGWANTPDRQREWGNLLVDLVRAENPSMQVKRHVDTHG